MPNFIVSRRYSESCIDCDLVKLMDCSTDQCESLYTCCVTSGSILMAPVSLRIYDGGHFVSIGDISRAFHSLLQGGKF